MKTVTIRKPSEDLKRSLASASEDEIVLRTPEGEEYLVSLVDEFAYEVFRQRRNKRLMTFLDQRIAEARAGGGIPLREVERRLGLPAYQPKKTKAPRRNGRKKS
jgi:hypothetical protein